MARMIERKIVIRRRAKSILGLVIAHDLAITANYGTEPRGFSPLLLTEALASGLSWATWDHLGCANAGGRLWRKPMSDGSRIWHVEPWRKSHKGNAVTHVPNQFLTILAFSTIGTLILYCVFPFLVHMVGFAGILELGRPNNSSDGRSGTNGRHDRHQPSRIRHQGSRLILDRTPSWDSNLPADRISG